MTYTTIQFHHGGLLARPAVGEPWSMTHLVVDLVTGGAGRILCGIDRHARRQRDGTPTPGWSVGGGVSGPSIAVIKCEGCDAARDRALPIHGLNASVFPGRRDA